MSVKIRLAAGLIIFRRHLEQVEYLLLESTYDASHWTPPKGHLDEGETDLQAALRETKEEAGLEELQDYEIISKDFKIESNYIINGNKSKPKRVIYWIAEAKPTCRDIQLSDEHKSFKWFNIDDCLKAVEFEESKRVMREAHEFIKNRK